MAKKRSKSQYTIGQELLVRNNFGAYVLKNEHVFVTDPNKTIKRGRYCIEVETTNRNIRQTFWIPTDYVTDRLPRKR